jgi:prepilin-type N-terminal cleavage/methylation domain-containing protein
MSRGGFTLVELLIGFAVLGILLAIAASTFTGLREKYRVEAATKQLYADLMDARARALQRNRVCFVRFAANGAGYTTYVDTYPGPDGNGMFDNGANPDTVCAQVSGTNPIDLSLLAGAATFRFDRNGLASATGTIRFTSVENIKNEQRDEAVSVAEAQIQAIRNTPFDNVLGLSSASFPVVRRIRGIDRTYTVQRTVNSLDAPANRNLRVAVDVRWDRLENGQTRTYNHAVSTIVRAR